MKVSGTTLVLIGGQKGILSMGAGLAFEEIEIVVIEFNRIGEVAQLKTFQKEDYHDELKALIEEKLILSRHLRLEELTSINDQPSK